MPCSRHWLYTFVSALYIYIYSQANLTHLIGVPIQYRSKVSYHLSSRFSRDGSRFSRDVSRFSRDASRFSRESLMCLVWHILRVRNRTCVTVAALQFVGKSMGPSNIRCASVLYLHKLHV